jgi:hypothetical protein
MRQLAEPAAARALDQRRSIEPRRVERLQQIVAGGGEETRLVAVGRVGFGARDFEFGIDACEIGRALLDATLERGVHTLERGLGADPRGDVDEADDEPAIGQPRRMEFERLSGRAQALADRRLTLRQCLHALRREHCRIADAEIAATTQMERDLVKRSTCFHQFIGQI